MHSVSGAMLWEMIGRGRWQIPGWFLFGNAFPFLLYAAFSHFQADFADPSFVILHVILLQLTMLIFGLGIVAAQGSLSRLFLLPVSTARIVVWHLLPGGLLLSLEVAASLSMQNAWFGLRQPVFGPALFAASAWASAQMLVGLSHRVLRSILLASIPLVLSFCWFAARYGQWFQQPSYYWYEVTIVEMCTAMLSCAICCFLTVKAVARDRCGERLQALPLWKAVEHSLERIADRLFRSNSEFRSATDAQLWFEWRSKGIALPAIVAFVAFMNAVVVPIRLLITGNWAESLQDFEEFALGAGLLLPLVAVLAGLLLGTTYSGPQSRDHAATIRDLNTQEPFDQMSSFLASRPITSAQYAAVILQTAARAVGWGWTLWALATFTGGFLSLLTDVPLPGMVFSAGSGWYLPGTLLAAWIGITCVASAVLTGRFARFSMAFVSAILASIVFNPVTDQWASQQLKQILLLGLSGLICLLILIGTSLAFASAVRRALLSSRVVRRCVGFWFVLNCVALLLQPPGLPPSVLPCILSFTTLVILPFATTPLAIAWNRHR